MNSTEEENLPLVLFSPYRNGCIDSLNYYKKSKRLVALHARKQAKALLELQYTWWKTKLIEIAIQVQILNRKWKAQFSIQLEVAKRNKVHKYKPDPGECKQVTYIDNKRKSRPMDKAYEKSFETFDTTCPICKPEILELAVSKIAKIVDVKAIRYSPSLKHLFPLLAKGPCNANL
jgi:hypothetical protein